MTYIFHREPTSTLPTCVGGSGSYLIDAAGKSYLDASGGAAVSILGHGNERVLRAIREQSARLAYAHTSFFTNLPSEALAERLISKAPPGLTHVYFVSGGSEANEAALKLARQFHVDNGEPDRSIVLHRRQSYHGATLSTLAVSGNPIRRAPYEPMLMPSPEVAPCYAYRHQRDGESELDYAQRAADDLEAAILRAPPGSVAAFIAEPIVGATLGAVPPARGYLRRVRQICDKHGVLLIADEIMCGMGRTGSFFACIDECISPDLLTVAKGLGAGYLPIGALLVQQRIYETVVRGRGRFEHGHTYIGHPIASAAALAVQDALIEDGLLEAVKPLGEQVMAALRSVFAEHPHVGDIRGRGLLIGLELVAERERKTPFPATLKLARTLKARAMEEGLIVYPGSGTADGSAGDHILIAPPYIWEERQIGELVTKLSRTLDKSLVRANVAA